MYVINVIRTYKEKQTIGIFSLLVEGSVKVRGVTLELPWKDNKKDQSCIPEGVYDLEVYDSAKFGRCLHVLDVPGRDGVLIHAGNYTRDTHGCILPGSQFTDLDGDGLTDVTASKSTLSEIMLNISGTGKIIIKNS